MPVIDMSNPNVLARTIIAQSKHYNCFHKDLVVPADLNKTCDQCRVELVKLGYVHKDRSVKVVEE